MNKILFDLSFVKPETLFTGVAKYGYRLLQYIVNANRHDNYILLINEQSVEYLTKMFPQFKYAVIGKKWMRKIPFKSFFYAVFFREYVNKLDVGLVFCPWGCPINCLKLKHRKISVVHDLQVRIDSKLHTKKEVAIYKFAENRIMNNSDFVFTISEFSKNQILSFYPNHGSKILNMSNSVSMIEGVGLKPMQVEFDYLLYVGRLCSQKNVMTLVKAFFLIVKQYPRLKLVLLAKSGAYWENIIKPFAVEHDILERIILTGQCTEENLSQWYLGAKCFVFPSLREGFGFPPIEAAFMGIPVITSKADSLAEVTLGLLNYYDPPMDEMALARAIKDVLDNPPSDIELNYVRTEFEKKYSIKVFGNRICNFLESYANN